MTSPARKMHDEEEEVEVKKPVPVQAPIHEYPLAMYKKAESPGMPNLEERAINAEDEKALIARGYINGHDFFSNAAKAAEKKA